MIATNDRNARVYTVTSGKGGVGKTNVSVNLSVALARLGRRTMLVDCDLGLANANILLGLDTPATIADLIASDFRLDEVIRAGPSGLAVVAGNSGAGPAGAFGDAARERLARAFRPHAGGTDHVIVDTAAGVGRDTLAIAAASDRVIIVLSPEPTAFMDAYSVVKLLALKHGRMIVSVVTNRVQDDAKGEELFAHFRAVTERFLATELVHLGSIPEDRHVAEAVYAKTSCVELYPDCLASIAFTRIARRLAGETLPALAGGNLFFGMEALHGAH